MSRSGAQPDPLVAVVVASPDLDALGRRRSLGVVRIVGAGDADGPDLAVGDDGVPPGGITIAPAGAPLHPSTRSTGTVDVPDPPDRPIVDGAGYPEGALAQVRDGSLVQIGSSLVAVHRHDPVQADQRSLLAGTAATAAMPFGAVLLGSAPPTPTSEGGADGPRQRHFRTDATFLTVRVGSIRLDGPGTVEPVLIDLARTRLLWVHGPVAEARALVRSVLVQLVALRQASDVVVSASSGSQEWSWLARLPHDREPEEATQVLADMQHDGARPEVGPHGVHQVLVIDRPGEAWPAGLHGQDPATVAAADASTVIVIGDQAVPPPFDLRIDVDDDLLAMFLHWGGEKLEVAWPEGISRAAIEDWFGPSAAERPRLAATADQVWAAPEEEEGSVPLLGWEVGSGTPVEVRVGPGEHILFIGGQGRGKSFALHRVAHEVLRTKPEAELVLIDAHMGCFDYLATEEAVLDVVGQGRSGQGPGAARRAARGLRHLLRQRAAGQSTRLLIIVIDELRWTFDRGEAGHDLREVLRDCVTRGKDLGIQVVAATQAVAQTLDPALRTAFPHRVAFYTSLRDDAVELVGASLDAPARQRAQALFEAGATRAMGPVVLHVGDACAGEATAAEAEVGILGRPLPPPGMRPFPRQQSTTLPPLAAGAPDLRAVIGYREEPGASDPRWVLDLQATPITLVIGPERATPFVTDAVARSLAGRTLEDTVAVRPVEHLDAPRFESLLEQRDHEADRAHLVIVARSSEPDVVRTIAALHPPGGSRDLTLVTGADSTLGLHDVHVIRPDRLTTTPADPRWLDGETPCVTFDAPPRPGGSS